MGVSIPSFYAKHVAGPYPGSNVPDGFTFFDDFLTIGGKFSTVTDAADWLVTADNGGSRVVSDSGLGGILTMTPGTSANDFNSAQLNGEIFQIGQGRTIRFAARIRTNDADDIKFFIGLAATDATGTTAGPVLDGVNDSIGFRNTAGNSTSYDFVVEDDTTETLTAGVGTLADDTFTVLAFEVVGGVGGYVDYWVDGVYKARVTTNLPDVGAYLTPTIEVGSPTGTTATNVGIDWILVESTRV